MEDYSYLNSIYTKKQDLQIKMILELLKKIPIDLGQGNLRKTTKGKVIAKELVTNGKNKTALDIGCREGFQSKWLEKKGYEVTSIDIKKVYEKCMVINVDKGFPFKNNSFDLIWCSEVIEHLDDVKKSIIEFKRVLKQNGKMILTTPNSYFWLMWFFYSLGFTPKKLQNKGHKHFFNEKRIKGLFPNAKIYGFFPYFIIKFKIKRLIGLLSPTFIIYDTK